MNEYKNKSILLVEDETVIALIQSAVLKKNGFNVKSVLSGEKAVALLESCETFDLILMDIDLGKGMSGTEAAEKILSMCDIPILFLSSHTEPEIVEKTEGITSYGYVVKNSGDTVLLASIRMAFRLFDEKLKVQSHREQLQTLNEELEGTNEELNAAFEELEAANEELIQSQNDLIASEEKFRRLFMSSNDGICVHELIYSGGEASDYRILDVNTVYESITGLKKNDISGKTASEIYGTGFPPYLDVYASVAETGVPHTFDTYFEPMDKYFYISVFSPGKGMFATAFQDITDRVRAENILHERERELNLILKSMMNAFVLFESVFDHEGKFISYRFVFINDVYERITGVKNDEVKGRTVHEVWPGTEESWVEAYGSVAVTGVSRTFEMFHEPTGKIYNCSVYRPGETSERFCVIFEDITERIKSEKIIRESEEKFRNIFLNAPIGLLHYNSAGVITECNDIFVGIIGSSKEKLTGLNMHNLKDSRLIEALDRSLTGYTGYYEGEYVSVTADKITPVRVWFVPLFTSDNKVSGGLCITEDVSVQKKALEELKHREEQFRNLFETLPQGIVYQDENGRIIEANPAAQKILGITLEQMLGVTSEDKRWRSVREDFTDFPGEEHPAMTALRTGEPVRDVIMGVYNPENEGYKWLRVDAVPEFRGAGGKPYRVYASLTDITERREIEMVFEEQRRLLDTLINAIPSPIFFKDVTGVYMGCNDAFSNFIGLDKDSIIGKTVFDISPGEYAGVYHRADLNIMERNEDTVYEADVRHADGTIRHVIFHKAVFHDSDGSMKGLVGIMLDISERKRYEDELRRIKDDLEKAQGAAHIGSWRWHIKEDRVEWSDELYHIFGLKKSSFNGKLSDLLTSSIHPDDRGKVEESNRLVLEENKPNAAEFRVVRNDGSIRVVWSEAGELEVDESGNPSILRGYLQDITERKKTEAELEHAVKEQEALLRELQHRVKNNLAMINGLIGLESTRSGDSKVIAVLHNLRNRIGSLERLFSSLYYTGNVTEIRLDSYISEIAGSIAKTYISEVQKIKLVTDLEPIVVSVKQAASVGLITNELLINALKYAFPHSMEGKIIITLKSSLTGYELAVTDNGVGLPEGFNVKNATGSGIMIIEMLSEHMGGDFNAESGEFTSFRVTVPSENGDAAGD